MFRNIAVVVVGLLVGAVPPTFLHLLHADEPAVADAGVVAPPTTIRLNGEIEGDFTELLAQLNLAKDDVTLVITSEGGSVVSGMRLILAIEDIRAKNKLRVHCIADMFALSMAAAILESGACDDRAMTDRTLILFHGVQAPPSPISEALNNSMAAWISHRLGITPEAYRAHIAKGDWILSPPAALEAHVVDRVLSP